MKGGECFPAPLSPTINPTVSSGIKSSAKPIDDEPIPASRPLQRYALGNAADFLRGLRAEMWVFATSG